MTTPVGPLAEIRIVDMGLFTAGPLAGRILSDLGADVVKVEPPGGDPTRRIGGQVAGGSSYLFAANNAGKRSITLDLKLAEDCAELHELIAVADVLLANFTLSSMEERGIGPGDCRNLNPQLVYCLVSGYGLTGPYRRERAMDMCTQARSGMMAATGPADGYLPTKVGISVVDDLAATAAATAIVSALAERDRSHRGQLVDVALMDLGAWATQFRWPAAQSSGLAAGLGNADPITGLDDVYEASDGYVAVSIRHGEDVDVITRFLQGHVASHVTEGETDLHAVLRTWIRTRTSEGVVDELRSQGIPVARAASVADVAAGDHARARGMLGGSSGTLPVVSSPICLDGLRLTAATGAPACGEHGDEVRHEWLTR